LGLQKDNPPVDRPAARFLSFLSEITSSRIIAPPGGECRLAVRRTLAHPWD